MPLFSYAFSLKVVSYFTLKKKKKSHYNFSKEPKLEQQSASLLVIHFPPSLHVTEVGPDHMGTAFWEEGLAALPAAQQLSIPPAPLLNKQNKHRTEKEKEEADVTCSAVPSTV